MENVIRQAMKVAQAAELFCAHEVSTPVRFEANRLKSIQTREGISYALRVVVDGRVGFATATSLDDRGALVQMAVETAHFGDKADLVLPERTQDDGAAIYDPAVETVPLKDMVALGQGAIDALRRSEPELVCEAWIGKGMAEVEVLNSSGLRASYRKSFMGMSAEGTLVRGTDMLFIGDSESSCRPISDAAPLTEIIMEQLENARNMAPAPQGEVPVVFTPLGVANVLLMPLSVGFNGRNVLQGSSPLTGQQGKDVFHPSLSLRDDPTVPYSPASRPWDDEGTPSQVTALVDGGRVANFLYDIVTAAKAGTRSTGNGVRMSGGPPSPSPTAWVIEPGDTPYRQMIAGLDDGLIVEEVIGAGMGNVLGGDFAGNVLLGYRVQKGKIVGRVKDTLISGNAYQVLKNILSVGKEPRWVGGRLLTPALCCGKVSVSTRQA
ncbi:MAG: TldD/PmbA family protein [Chloroflexi bacterium]|nr:TldD/PmbA family protein [Chloroflexota bacterium]